MKLAKVLSDPDAWDKLSLINKLHEVRHHFCTGPCGQSASVGATRSATDKVLKEAIAKIIALQEFCVHDRKCVLQSSSAGRPTPDGGYEVKIGGTWYQQRPVDMTPKCTCGLDEVLAEVSK